MSSLLPFELETHTSPTLFWAWGAATLLLATGLGFLAGATYANRSADRGFRKALEAISSLYALALDSLDKAQHLSSLLESFPGAALTAEEVDRLDSKRGSLVETVGRLIGKQREGMAKQLEAQTQAEAPAHPDRMAADFARSGHEPPRPANV